MGGMNMNATAATPPAIRRIRGEIHQPRREAYRHRPMPSAESPAPIAVSVMTRYGEGWAPRE
ncbi:hypothetical protein GCM10029978_118060 [Actinoallomurus acanthiterrae]